MAADFPAAIPSLLTTDLLSDYVAHSHKIKILEELDAVCRNVGTNAHGSYGSIDARLDAIEAQLATFGSIGYRNVRLQNNSSTPNSKVDVTADVLCCEGSVLTSVSVTADITAEGKNGFDNLGADAEDANTWYYIWVGTNPTTTEVCALLSKASARASLVLSHASLSGFSRFRRVGAIRNDGSSHFLRVDQHDGLLYYRDPPIAHNGTAPGSAAFFDVSLATWVSPTSRLAHLLCSLGTSTAARGLSVRQNGVTTGILGIHNKPSSPDDMRIAVPLATDASQVIEAAIVDATVTPVNETGVYILVLGYHDPI